jgi:hypothetical protein
VPAPPAGDRSLEVWARSSIGWQLGWLAPILGLGIARRIAGVHRPIGFLVTLIFVGALGAYSTTSRPTWRAPQNGLDAASWTAREYTNEPELLSTQGRPAHMYASTY